MPENYTDQKWMRHALNLARRAWGQTHPNPLVGAVIVESDAVVAEGWHRADGAAHAEVEALNELGRAPAKDATLYVTLEPCSTHGRTGACTSAILEAGFRRVVIGADDPNPVHAGKGLQILRAAGVEVVNGVLAAESTDLNLIFKHWITQKTPLIAAKIATTGEGEFAPSEREARWVTGAEARLDVMRWRQYFPAIGVSANTALSDDPALTVRQASLPEQSPRRFVFDRNLKTAKALKDLKIFKDAFVEATIVVCAPGINGVAAYNERGTTLWELPHPDGRLDWAAFRERCVEEELYGIYLEPGPTLSAALLAQGEVDYLFHYIAPGASPEASPYTLTGPYQLEDLRKENHGVDQLVRGWLTK
ncbi:MAG: Riboflavin biosynthesis protein RibD [Opitutia bacterium UBA7350]|nr:MAG: Riboflavin biosynthesis protein RibD [Opitutae bacterium UBA7350]